MINDIKNRAKKLEKSIIDINIKSEGKISLTECYFLPYQVREMYYELYNKYVEKINKKSS